MASTPRGGPRYGPSGEEPKKPIRLSAYVYSPSNPIDAYLASNIANYLKQPSSGEKAVQESKVEQSAPSNKILDSQELGKAWVSYWPRWGFYQETVIDQLRRLTGASIYIYGRGTERPRSGKDSHGDVGVVDFSKENMLDLLNYSGSAELDAVVSVVSITKEDPRNQVDNYGLHYMYQTLIVDLATIFVVASTNLVSLKVLDIPL